MRRKKEKQQHKKQNKKQKMGKDISPKKICERPTGT